MHVRWQQKATDWAQSMLPPRQRHDSKDRPPRPSHDADRKDHGGMRTTRTRPPTEKTVTVVLTVTAPSPTPWPTTPLETACVTETVTRMQALRPPFAVTMPLSSAQAYPSDRFGGEVLGVALGAAVLAVGVMHLVRAVRA